MRERKEPKPLVLDIANEADRQLLKLRLQKQHAADMVERQRERERRFRDEAGVRAAAAKLAVKEAQKLYRKRLRGEAEPHTIKPLDARFAAFRNGDLVQMSMVGIRRQRKSVVHKTIDTKGVYVGRGSNKGEGYANVDWIVDDPWPHKQRQLVQIDYIEPLGTPR